MRAMCPGRLAVTEDDDAVRDKENPVAAEDDDEGDHKTFVRFEEIRRGDIIVYNRSEKSLTLTVFPGDPSGTARSGAILGNDGLCLVII